MTFVHARPHDFNPLASTSSDKMSLNRDFVDSIAQTVDYPSIQTAFEQDRQYNEVYDEYARTGTVHQLLVDRESLSMMMHWISGASAHTPKHDDYADAHVSISATSRTLTIKHWLIAHPTLTIKLYDIVYILPAPYVVPHNGVAAWGVGSTGVGWARDVRRMQAKAKEYEHSYVCKFKSGGREFYAGFTVDEPAGFVEVLEDAW